LGQSSQFSSGRPDVLLQLASVERISPEVVRVEVYLRQRSQAPVRVAFDEVETHAIDEPGRRFSVVSGGAGRGAFAPRTLSDGQRLGLVVDFAIPDAATGRFELVFAPAPSDRDSARFPPLAFRLPAR
jgi:hypothetical protein